MKRRTKKGKALHEEEKGENMRGDEDKEVKKKWRNERNDEAME